MCEVSVIIPVYNSEQYLLELSDSLMAQSFKDYEVLFVNDGSTDKSEIILEEICKHDHRFNVLTQTNSGQSKARLHGLIRSRGKYVTFVDGDDYLRERHLENLYAGIVNNAVNMSMVNVLIVPSDESKSRAQVTGIETGLIDKYEYKLLFLSGKIPGFMCNKMFIKEDLLIDLLEDSDNYMEDLRFLSYQLAVTKDVYYKDEATYCYRQNSNSVTHNKISIDQWRTSRKTLGILNGVADTAEETGAVSQRGLNIYLYLLKNTTIDIAFRFSKEIITYLNEINSLDVNQVKLFDRIILKCAKYKVGLLSLISLNSVKHRIKAQLKKTRRGIR